MIINKGGLLQPKIHDGTTQDLVYGVDEAGRYLGLTSILDAPQQANSAPPRHGAWRWISGAWASWKSRELQALEIEIERDGILNGGFEHNGHRWYADNVFSGQVTSLLAAFREGLLGPEETVGIRAMDKEIYQLDQDELRELAGVLMVFVQGVYEWSWERKAEIEE